MQEKQHNKLDKEFSNKGESNLENKYSDFGHLLNKTIHALLKFDPEERAQKDSERIAKLLLTAESNWQIKIMSLFLRNKSKQRDEFFERIKQTVINTAYQVPNYPLFSDQGIEKQAEIQRWILAKYVEGLHKAGITNDHQGKLLRGIAWSLLADDAKDILKKTRQSIVNEWLFHTMAPLLRSDQQHDKVREELARFVEGVPQIIGFSQIPESKQ